MRSVRPAVAIVPLVAVPTLLWAAAAAAEETRSTAARVDHEAAADRFAITARSESYLQFFQRALLPGPNGAIVDTETALPVTEYLSVNARDVDAPWQKDSIDLEFSAWGQLWPTSSNYERPFDGDVQTASLRYDAGPVFVRLGRQQMAGGAARFARFDGVTVGARQALGFFAEGYGGYGVLPRWNGQPGYHHLGSAEDELMNDTGPPEERSTNWLAGGRVGVAIPRLSGSLSFHEQHETGGLAQRNLGLDLGAQPFELASLGARALFELDSQRFAHVRAWALTTPVPRVDLGAEFARSEPALLLSRQSVLSVFSTDGYEELGGNFAVRATRWLRVEGNGYLQLYDDTGPGARAELATRLATGKLLPTMLRLAYSRVIAPENGYHSVRASFSRALSLRVACTLEAYGYLYDDPIAGVDASAVYAATASYRVSEPLELLWGGSIANSPYALFDAQTLLRAIYSFDPAPIARRQ